ncbi:autotransporter outer membrane beta-barrel domain-containing protein, partial [uncultured Helicobacter sp.]|uniref:autotransporter outer membrane beta-barrel domain-containing protein n=1 Tax=uncultured Helicobacter sp. TaxID=175537 RepID=UPI00262E6E92
MALQATGTAPSITTDPTDHTSVNITDNTWVDSVKNTSLIWNLSGDIYTIQKQVNNGSKTNINGFNLRFSNGSNDESSLPALTIESWQNNSAEKAGILVGTSVTSLTLDFQNKGLQLQGAGELKTWTIHFQGSGKTLNVNNLQSLEGNLNIYTDNFADIGENTYIFSLKSMTGDIQISGAKGGMQKGEITFDQTGLRGDILSFTDIAATSENGGITVKFNGSSTMVGDIKGAKSGNDLLKRTVIFNTDSSSPALVGNIFSYGTDISTTPTLGRSVGNHIVFTKGNMQGSIVASNGVIGNNSAKKGYNSITFNSGTEQTLTGGILADDSHHNGSDTQATNTLNVGANTTLKIIASEKNQISDTTQVQSNDSTKPNTKTFDLTTGSIIARGGINEVNLAKNAALVLDSGNGNIETLSNGSNSNTKSKIFFNGASGTLQGNIATNAGVATITIANDASGTITGNITKTGGTNNITLGVNTPITYIRGVQTLAPTAPATSASLTLQGAENAISTLTTTATNSTLTIDASNNSNSTTIATVSGSNLIANFKSAETHSAKLSLTTTSSGLTIKDITATAGENNILALSGTDTATISNDVSIDANKGIIFDLSSGSSITFANGITTAGTTTFKLGGTSNTITGTLTNNGTHNFVVSKDTTLKCSTTGLTFSSGNNNINFIDNATLDWKDANNQSQAIATSGSSTTTITVANEKSGVIAGSITTTAGSTNVVLGSANAGLLETPTPTPTTLTLKGTINQITSITANVDGAKLVLDTSTNLNTTTISGGVSGDNKLTIHFKGENANSGKTAKLTLNGTSNKLKAITLEANSKNNTLEIASGSTSVNDNFSVTTDQKMSFEVQNGAKLAFANGLSNTGGTINIKSEGASVGSRGVPSDTTVAGNIITSNSSATTNLYFRDSLWMPASVSANSTGTVTVSGGTSNIAVELTNGSGLQQIAMYNVVTMGGTNNILVNGTTNIGANVTYSENGMTNLMFVSMVGTKQLNLDNQTDLNTPEDGVSMFGKTFSNGVILTLQDKKVKSGSEMVSFLSLAGKNSSNPAFSFTTQRDTNSNTDTVNLNGVAVGTIKAIGAPAPYDITPQTHTYNVVLDKNAVFAGTIDLYGSNQVINLSMNEASKLFVENNALHIENLEIKSSKLDVSNIEANSFTQNNVVIDLATDGNSFENISRNVQQDGYRVLVIGPRSDAGAKPYAVAPTGLTGDNGLFRVYVDPSQEAELGKNVLNIGTAFQNAKAHSDRILVNNGTAGTHYIQAIYKEGTEIGKISYNGGGVETEGNIAVATVAKNTNITFLGANQVQGFDVIGTKLTEGIETDAQGQVNGAGAKNYKTFFIDSTVSKGIADGSIQTTTSALGINYDLFLANFNSLNKRMGELRDNNNGQGAWARVFVGGLSTSYGLETQSTYTTIQAGYDYAFGFEGANNYLGVVLSYANALTDTKKSIDVGGVVSGIDKTSTNGIEVALYNSYIEDSGWFNDTIFKFSYMMSDVKVINQSDTYSTNNFGIVLSDEFGYRFKLGESKEWYIDPQLEVGFGYFNQSDLKQVLGQATLTGIQNAIATLRARVGANWAYDFKNFTQGKGINVSVYLGTYYSYDYISGGEISLVTDLGTKGKLKPLSSTGRFELNVGTNIEVQSNTRIYFDFEKSFGGDITTEYQVNLGVRYS